MRLDTLKASNEFIEKAKEVALRELGEETLSNGQPTVVKQFGDHQFMLLQVKEDDETKERLVSLTVSDALVVLPSSKDTLDIFTDAESGQDGQK